MYFPIILILFVLSNFFNIWSKHKNKAARCMRALGLVNWTYGDSFDVEKIEEGRQLVKQARAKKSNITVLSDTGSAGTKTQSQIVSTFLFLVLRYFCSSISRSLGIYEFAPSRKEHALIIFIYMFDRMQRALAARWRSAKVAVVGWSAARTVASFACQVAAC